MIEPLLLIACLGAVASDNAAGCSSNKGKEFHLGIIHNYHDEHYYYKLTLDVAATSTGSLFINVPFLGIIETKQFREGVTVITFNKTLQRWGSFIENRGIYINSTEDVSIYVTNFLSGASTDTYMALPSHCLGNRYVVTSYAPSDSAERSEFMVVGVYDSTHVNVTLSNGATMTKTINRHDTYQEAAAIDLTNTVIQTDKNVAVIAGTSCSEIDHAGACDVIMSQLFPTTLLGKEFIVPPVYPSTQSTMRILNVGQYENRICIDAQMSDNSTLCQPINPHQFREKSNWSQAEVILGKHYLLIALYKSGDPFMAIIPSVDQYLNDYSFAIPEVYSDHVNYLAVTIPSSKTKGLRFNGQSPPRLVHSYFVSQPFSNYTVQIYTTRSGYHHITHTDHVPFGIICYGTQSLKNYGFPAGANFENKNQAGPMCFTCQDASHPELCDTVQQCRSNEVCYMEKYQQHNNFNSYKSGCIDKSTCLDRQNTSLTNDQGCVSCCNNDFCNNKGCGETGLPPRDQRGPVCFDCEHTAKPDECHGIQPCHINQVCGIELLEWGEGTHYKMGCSSAMCEPLHAHGDIIAPRSTPICKACCAEDYCNRNCTSVSASHGSETSIIVG